jgi:hypothetical protein
MVIAALQRNAVGLNPPISSTQTSGATIATDIRMMLRYQRATVTSIREHDFANRPTFKLKCGT